MKKKGGEGITLALTFSLTLPSPFSGRGIDELVSLITFGHQPVRLPLLANGINISINTNAICGFTTHKLAEITNLDLFLLSLREGKGLSILL